MQLHGTLKLIGMGTFGVAPLGAMTVASVIDIGDHSIKSVRIGNYLMSYLKVGDEFTLLVLRIAYFRILSGLRPTSGGTYMEGRIVLLPLLLTCTIFPLGVLYILFAVGVVNLFTLIVGGLCVLPLWQSFGNVVEYIKFKSGA